MILSKIGATTDIGKLKEQLKFINTNMQFYQQAMLTETNEKNRDIMFSYYNAYKDIRKVANAQMDGLQKELEVKNKKIAEQEASRLALEYLQKMVSPSLGPEIGIIPENLNTLEETFVTNK